MTPIEILTLKLKIAAAFTPSAPIDKSTLFAGRSSQVTRLMNAVAQKGQHAILFGERGVGKTSLANVLQDFLKQFSSPSSNIGFLIGSTNCEGSSTFQSIWTALLRDVKISQAVPSVGFGALVNAQPGTLLDYCPEPKSSEDVRHFLENLGHMVIFVIDEFDQIRDGATKKAIADTIKTLSDRAITATIVVVGVADSVTDLLAEHVSIERALVQIPMPRMSTGELQEIINKGIKSAGMTIDPGARDRIASLSQGLPHYTHLMSLHAAQNAADAGRLNIAPEDIEAAIKTSVEQAQQSIVTAYVKSTTSRRGNLYTEVLTACALTAKDELGYFAAADVREPMSRIMKREYDIPAFSQHLNDFCTPERKCVLQKTGFPRRYRFRFSNPLMEPFVVMKGITRGLIDAFNPSGAGPQPSSEQQRLSLQ